MTTIASADVIDQHPLTSAQLGLVFHVLSEPGEHLFMERVTCPLYGEIDIAAFVQAWRTLVARHGSLRTGFILDGDEGPIQVVHSSAELDIQVEDWTALDPAEVSAKTDVALAEEVERDFDLQHPPLMRLKIARTAAKESLLIWSSHHLIVDGWSCWILLCEAALLYLADRHGIALELPPCPGFIEYARWLALQDRSEQHCAYWRTYFEGYKPRPYVGSAGRGRREFCQDHARLSREATDAALAWQRRTRIALNTLLQAAWALVLAQEEDADPEEVLFGTVFSGRSAGFPGATSVVGLMISVLPVRVPVCAEMPVSEWLDLLQQRHAEMLLHDSCTVQEVQRWAGIDGNRLSFASVLLLMNVDPLEGLPELGFRIGRPRYLANANYPLGVNVTPGDEMTIEMLYDKRHFSAERIQKLQVVFAAAIGCIVEARDERVGDLQQRIRAAGRQRVSERRNALASRLAGALSTAASGNYEGVLRR